MVDYDPAGTLRKVLPGAFEGPKKVLYVGASPHRFELSEELVAAGHEITVLEVWKPNVIWLQENCSHLKIVKGDIRLLHTLRHACGLEGHYDIAIWWHGPEHIREFGFRITVCALEMFTDLVVLASPWGHCPQGNFDGNPHEAHCFSVYEHHFHDLGYQTVTRGEPDIPPRSYIIGWRYTKV